MTYRYREIPDADVPTAMRRAGELAVHVASTVLNVGRTRIAWFLPDPHGRVQVPSCYATLYDDHVLWGMYRPGDEHVWMNAGLGPIKAAFVGLHEVRHRWQFATAGLIDEPDAYDWADKTWATYGHHFWDTKGTDQ